MSSTILRIISVAGLILFGCGSCAPPSPPRSWSARVETELGILGYRNWVVFADAAFPVYSRRGVRTVQIDDEIPVVLDDVLQILERSQNVTPRMYVPRELAYVTNDRAPGIDQFRKTVHESLRGFPTREMEYRSLVLMLEDSAEKVAVVVFKTKTTLPYSCVFMELDSGYWDAESERELRDRLEKTAPDGVDMKHDAERLTREREEAWIGDAVLALFVREWILREEKTLDGDRFTRFTSNDFLRLAGNPTRVEAEIGRLYRDEGLVSAFGHIEANLLPMFEQQEKVRRRRIRSGGVKG